MNSPSTFAGPAAAPRRIDLHCHSSASNITAEALLNALHCPECYSEPHEVYQQARRRGMDLVTITDHDTIAGVRMLGDLPDVMIGEELTCWFPEDHCKMHVLVWGISPRQHEHLQSIARDIYAVARYVESQRIAHAVAHPIYRQNDRLERWHLERLLLLFKGFECLNGAHSPLHREAFEPLLEWLSRDHLEKLSARHDLRPLWPQPWIKARTGGSDDHGLLNIGRTWTEFPPDADTPDKILQCLRDGTCRPGGEAGSSAKLAHTFYSVAVRYYSRHILPPNVTPNFTTSVLQSLVGERPAPSKSVMARTWMRAKLRGIGRALTAPFRSEAAGDSISVLKKLFLTSFHTHLKQHPSLKEALRAGMPPLGEHESMLALIHRVNRDVTRGLADAIVGAVDAASFTGLFDSIAGLLAQQFVLCPYYFALFHQNKERHLLRKLTGRLEARDETTLRIGLFTDTLDDINGVGRFLRDMAGESQRLARHLVIHTCCPSPHHALACRKNFAPLLSRPMPCYPQLQISLPPVLEVLEWADRQQFDAIHVSTPGPMGLCGLLAGWMLRVPVLGTFHTDFPAYAERLTGDHRVVNGVRLYCRWFYHALAAVLSRSKAYELNLQDLGLPAGRIMSLPPGVDVETFSPRRRDPIIWPARGIKEPLRLLYCGRISVEKNLDFLADVFARLCARRRDTALILAGVGPHQEALRQRLSGLPAYFPGALEDDELPAMYASADLLMFPSTTDTLGQAVLEAQASGLPAIVSNLGGPREIVENEVTGLVLPARDPQAWALAIDKLLADSGRRSSMSAAAVSRAGGYSLRTTFEQFWAKHLDAVLQAESHGMDSSALAQPVQ